jgi:hypothetical protein
MTTEETPITPPRHRVRSRALMGIGLVAVLGAALGAYLGIHGVEGAGSAPSTGQPPARSNAAMAFDAADGTVVMFGGQARSRSLDDTWVWNGSSWAQAHPATSPPALSGAQMTYDPVSHDVVLVGGDRVSAQPGGVAVCEGEGSAGSSSASGSSGSVKWIPPSKAEPADAPAPGGTLSIPPISTGCGFPDVMNSATWVWNGSDWIKATGSTPEIGFGEWNLATDPVSGKALLLADQTIVAQPDSPIAQPAIACPMQTTITNGVDGIPSCPVYPIHSQNRSWMWTGHAWQVIKATSTSVMDVFGSRVITDAVSGHLAVFGSAFLPVDGPVTGPSCPTCETGAPVPNDVGPCCAGTINVWNGTAWKQAKGYTKGPLLNGGTFVGDPSTDSDVLLTTNGQTWAWTGVWTQQHPKTTPTVLEGSAFAYDATTGQVVTFGGLSFGGRASGIYDQTWTWDGSDWTLRGGSTTPAVSIPVPSPVSVPPALPCNTALPKDVPQPQYACAGVEPGSTGGGTGSASGSAGGAPTGVSGNVSSSGVAAP